MIRLPPRAEYGLTGLIILFTTMAIAGAIR